MLFCLGLMGYLGVLGDFLHGYIYIYIYVCMGRSIWFASVFGPFHSCRVCLHECVPYGACLVLAKVHTYIHVYMDVCTPYASIIDTPQLNSYHLHDNHASGEYKATSTVYCAYTE